MKNGETIQINAVVQLKSTLVFVHFWAFITVFQFCYKTAQNCVRADDPHTVSCSSLEVSKMSDSKNNMLKFNVGRNLKLFHFPQVIKAALNQVKAVAQGGVTDADVTTAK